MATSRAATTTTDGEPACARLPVRVMARSLDFYLALGCDVRRAADGWGLRVSGADRFLLSAGPAAGARHTATRRLVLTVPDVRASWGRLVAAGMAPAGPDHADEQVELLDPDGYRVLVRKR